MGDSKDNGVLKVDNQGIDNVDSHLISGCTRVLTNNITIVPRKEKVKMASLINEFHYNFFSKKRYNTSQYSKYINIILLILLTINIFFTMYNVGNNYYFLGSMFFIILGFIWLMNILYIQYEINNQMISKFSNYMDNDAIEEYNENNNNLKSYRKFTNIFSVKNKKYIENIIDNWIRLRFSGCDILGVVDDVAKLKDLRKRYKTEGGLQVKEYINGLSSTANLIGLGSILFSVSSSIIIWKLDSNIFDILASDGGLKLYFLVAILVSEIVFILYMVLNLIKGAVHTYHDWINDTFSLDENPSDLRVDRFVRNLLLRHTHTIEVQLDDENESLNNIDGVQ